MMRSTRTELFEFISRDISGHQTHFEDLVLLGQNGLEELNDKIEKYIKSNQLSGKTLNLSTKIDGCLHKDTLIPTTVGDISFSKIVRDWPKVKYFGYGWDENLKIRKQVLIDLPHFIENNDSFYELEFENGGTLRATGNHPIKVGDTYKTVEELQVGDDCYENY